MLWKIKIFRRKIKTLLKLIQQYCDCFVENLRLHSVQCKQNEIFSQNQKENSWYLRFMRKKMRRRKNVVAENRTSQQIRKCQSDDRMRCFSRIKWWLRLQFSMCSRVIFLKINKLDYNHWSHTCTAHIRHRIYNTFRMKLLIWFHGLAHDPHSSDYTLWSYMRIIKIFLAAVSSEIEATSSDT